jgi:MoaA/NifB/PqqE/SkfB family radical SAM enzyme
LLCSESEADLNSKPQKSPEIDFNKIVTDSVRIFLKDALRTTIAHPSQAAFFVRTLRWQRKAAKIRQKLEASGLHVPPIMIFSVTHQCNLHCDGCYHQSLRTSPQPELSDERLKKAIAEAKELGVSFIVFAGGEPFMKPSVLDITREYPEIMFLIFTNGLLLNDAIIKRIAEKRNVVPLVSLEGYQGDTDARRGKGVYAQVQKSIAKLKQKDVFWGTSLTMTSENFNEVTDDRFIGDLFNAGCKLFMMTAYTPVTKETEDWVLTPQQRLEVVKVRDAFRAKYAALFIALPWDEDEVGGCLSAGRGFVHVSAEGNVEPCPFVPYSDTNLNNTSLKEALQSNMLRAIRENYGELAEINGCALWEKRAWVQSLATQSEKPKT